MTVSMTIFILMNVMHVVEVINIKQASDNCDKHGWGYI